MTPPRADIRIDEHARKVLPSLGTLFALRPRSEIVLSGDLLESPSEGSR